VRPEARRFPTVERGSVASPAVTTSPTTRTLSEEASKALLAPFGVPFAPEHVVPGIGEAEDAADDLGYPVVLKLTGGGIAHKTERGLVRLDVGDRAAVRDAARHLLGQATTADGPVALLVAPMLRGNRELIAGLARDPQFGMTVMVGVGGILAEAVADVAIRLVPVQRIDAEEMIDDLATQRLLGAFRGEPAVDRAALADVVLALSAAAEAHPEIVSADLNPLIVVDGRPIAVDALIEIEGGT
jgi:acetate---CoA ligase (ADP-forming) subunit beta